ncbi:MAG: AmmeMemoRadiSam system radical SAM enzyme [Candidatus Falkowbacteria bacterium]
MQEAKFYKKLADQTVACELCHQACLIKNDSTGICRARKNIDGKLFSLVYGYPAALNVDPIEKKPLFHFQPGSLSYSIGTLGCNFQCANCQNWNISQALNIEQKIKNINLVEPEKIVGDALANDCWSISYTYNEPTIFTEYALAIMELAHQRNLKNVWVSNGYMSDQCLKTIIPHLDAINVDLKSMDHEFYKTNCSAKLEPILKNLAAIKKSGVHLEITTLIIPGLSDDYEMFRFIAEFIVSELGTDVPWHVTKFSPAISWKLKKTLPTSEEIIFEACDIGKSAGLNYVYSGNTPGAERENTYCPSCGELAIRRFDYEIERLDNHGRCVHCDKNLDIFE